MEEEERLGGRLEGIHRFWRIWFSQEVVEETRLDRE